MDNHRTPTVHRSTNWAIEGYAKTTAKTDTFYSTYFPGQEALTCWDAPGSYGQSHACALYRSSLGRYCTSQEPTKNKQYTS